MRELRQSTDVTVVVGPFLDYWSGVTAETGVTIVGMDNAGIIKHGSGSTVSIGDRPLGALAGGHYGFRFTSSDTDTSGQLRLFFQDDSIFAPVWEDFLVLDQHIFDSKYIGVKQQINAVQIGGVTLSSTGGVTLVEGSLTSLQSSVSSVISIVSGLGLTSSAVNSVASGSGVTTGTQTGTYANTHADDGTYWQITSAGGIIEAYLEFTLGVDATPVSASVNGRLHEGSVPSGGDSCAIYAYDYIASTWELVSAGYTGITGSTAADDSVKTINLLVKHISSTGMARIRFYGTVLEANTVLYLDQVYVSYAITGSKIGYQDALVWVDTLSGVSGVVPYVNGTADNPVDTLAHAYTIASAVGLKGLRFLSGSGVSLTASADYWRFYGSSVIDLGGQSIEHAVFREAYTIYGSSTSDDASFIDCGIGSVTMNHSYFSNCNFKAKFTTVTGQEYFFLDCHDASDSSTAAEFVLRDNVTALFRNWQGGITFVDMTNADVIVDGAGRITIASTCSGGTITVRGHFPTLTGYSAFVLSGGTVIEDTRYSVDRQTIVGNNLDKTGYYIAGTSTTLDSLNDLNAEEVGSGLTDWTASEKAQIRNALGVSGTTASNVTGQVQFLYDMLGGRWKIEQSTNQMVFYKSDNITEIARFDLKDANASASWSNVFERTRG